MPTNDITAIGLCALLFTNNSPSDLFPKKSYFEQFLKKVSEVLYVVKVKTFVG